jgi:hypothetical protein
MVRHILKKRKTEFISLSLYLDKADIDCNFPYLDSCCAKTALYKKYVTQKSYSLFETVSRFKMDCFSLHAVEKNMRHGATHSCSCLVTVVRIMFIGEHCAKNSSYFLSQ